MRIENFLMLFNYSMSVIQPLLYLSPALILRVGQLRAKLDLHRFQQENEEARRKDSERLHETLRTVNQADHQILEV